jgi:hypothetical protein
MAAGTTPIFIDGVMTWVAQATAANTNRDGTGTIVDLVPAAADDGKLIEFLDFKAVSATAANALINIFLHNGTSWFFWKALTIGIVTPASDTDSAGNSVPAGDLPVALPTGWKLGFAPTTAITVNGVARGGTY